jgi:signal transduction histidine kinase
MRVTRGEALIGAVCAAWAAVAYAGEGAAALATAPLLGVAASQFRRRPAIAGAGVLGGILLAAAAGVPSENPGSLAAGFTVVYGIGRHADVRGLAVVAAIAVGQAAAYGLIVIDLVFICVVHAAVWGAGRLVRHRTAGAERTAAIAAELSARDPAELAARVVAEERARLAGEALAVVRAAVEAMRRDAIAAEATLDAAALERVQSGGRAAVADLRRLLGLLRDEHAPAAVAAVTGSAAGTARRRYSRRVDAAAAAALAALACVEIAVWGAGESLATTVAFVAPVALRRVDAALACGVALAAMVASAALDAPPAFGFAAATAFVLLSWSAAADGRPRSIAALVVLTAAAGVVSHAEDPGNEWFLIAMAALSAAAGHVFAVRGRESDASESAAGALRAAHRAAAERAARSERLRLARELHDVASHAVGVMVLQASAAAALRDRDRQAARAAVRVVQTAGAEAMAELEQLFGVLDAGAVGPPGLASAAGPELEPALHALVGRVRAGGLDVELDLAAAVAEPEVGATVLRIVQEALTNAVRHASGSRVTVAVRRADGDLLVEVRDDGAGTAASGKPGFGLVGLGERVRALGGELDAGPRDGGGFAVRARLRDSAREEAPA